MQNDSDAFKVKSRESVWITLSPQEVKIQVKAADDSNFHNYPPPLKTLLVSHGLKSFH